MGVIILCSICDFNPDGGDGIQFHPPFSEFYFESTEPGAVAQHIILVATVDGGRFNIHQRTAGRPKKGGRKHFVTERREPNVLTLYVLSLDGTRDETINSVNDGTLGDADALYELLCYHLLRLGEHRAADVTLAAEGAVWIWNRADELRQTVGLRPEQFTEIVDYFHAVERLGEHSRATHSGDDARLRWRAIQKKRPRASHIEECVRAGVLVPEPRTAPLRRLSHRWPAERGAVPSSRRSGGSSTSGSRVRASPGPKNTLRESCI